MTKSAHKSKLAAAIAGLIGAAALAGCYSRPIETPPPAPPPPVEQPYVAPPQAQPAPPPPPPSAPSGERDVAPSGGASDTGGPG